MVTPILEYDFQVVYKYNRSHTIADVLLQIFNVMEPIGVLHQISMPLFLLQLEWLQFIFYYLQIGQMHDNYIVAQHQHLTQKPEPFIIHKILLYKYGHDNQYHKCLHPAKILVVLYELYT
jgi:hypothetical protein